jgi:hypothetical protein
MMASHTSTNEGIERRPVDPSKASSVVADLPGRGVQLLWKGMSVVDGADNNDI